ncbi:MAG: LacI family DNA-binding transcriptional regulator [Microbacterium sp.]
MSGETVRQSAPTLHDVAREAGVSLATASRALNGSNRKVAESYRLRVVEAAERLGYTPNLSAQAIARGTSATIALLVADIADPYFGQIAAGVAQAADQAGLILTIAITERDPDRELTVVRALRGQRPRGVILASSRDSSGDADGLADELAAIQRVGGRVVTLGAALDGSRVVEYDNRAGAEALGAKLAEIGYRRAILLAGAEGLRTSDNRVAGFTSGFTSAGGEAPRVVRGTISRDSGYELASALVAEGVEPGTLLVGVADVVAIGAISAIRDAGRTPGADIAVAGFDDIASARDITPSLTTVHVPLEQLGRAALRAIIDTEWEGSTVPTLDVKLRDSTPPRTPTKG